MKFQRIRSCIVQQLLFPHSHILKKIILLATAATVSCMAATPLTGIVPPSTYELPSQVALAVGAIRQELDARIAKANGTHLELPSDVLQSPEQKAAARAVFGTENPLDIRRLPSKGRDTQYAWRIPGGSYGKEDAPSIWPEARLALSMNPNGNKLNITGTWDGMDLHDDGYTIAIKGVDIHADETRASSGIWHSDGRLEAQTITFTELASASTVLRAEQSGVRFASSRPGKKQDQLIDFRVKRLTIADLAIDDLHMAYRLRNISNQAVATYRRAMTAPPVQGESGAAQPMADLFKSLLLQGASLDIDDISATYAGGKIQLKGAIALPSATEADLSSAERILNKLEAHFDIRLPLSSLRGMVGQFQKLAAKDHVAGSQPAASERDIADYIVGKLLTNSYARIEKDTLVSSIDISNGRLRVNGSPDTIPFVQPLLKEWRLQNLTPPPKDATLPEVLKWSDRDEEHVLLFAGNKRPEAMEELCRRYLANKNGAEAYQWCSKAAEVGETLAQALLADMYRDGNGVKQDSQLAQQWRDKASQVSDAVYENITPTTAVPVQHFNVPAGHYDEVSFHFDETKLRSLEVVMKEGKEHEKWAPMVGVCLTALAPSDAVCLKLTNGVKRSGLLSATSRVVSTDHSTSTSETRLDATFAIGEKIHLDVFVLDQQVYFVMNGKKLAQAITFQPQVLQLVCSTGTCDVTFD